MEQDLLDEKSLQGVGGRKTVASGINQDPDTPKVSWWAISKLVVKQWSPKCGQCAGATFRRRRHSNYSKFAMWLKHNFLCNLW